MTADTNESTTPRILGPRDGQILGPPDGVRDRFLVDSADTDGGFSLVEHLLAPRSLAAPVHRHGREDEYTYVLEGQPGILLGDQEVFPGVGDLVFKPRGQWHTFWNASDAPARVLEIICPGGLEQLFRELGTMSREPEPAEMTALATRYGCEVDFEATGPLIQRHSLSF